MVERLDFSKPPPGLWADEAIWNGSGQPPDDDEHYSWGFDFEDGTKFYRTIEAAIAAAWAHYEARHDPPGLGTVQVCEGRWLVAAKPCTAPGADLDGRHNSQVEARAAAWAWYWRRLAVVERLEDERVDSALTNYHTEVPTSRLCKGWWPYALTWPGDQVAEVEAWLTYYTPGGQKVSRNPRMPEVLRG